MSLPYANGKTKIRLGISALMSSIISFNDLSIKIASISSICAEYEKLFCNLETRSKLPEDTFSLCCARVRRCSRLSYCDKYQYVLAFGVDKDCVMIVFSDPSLCCELINEPRHEKTNVLHMRKQRRRSASR